MFASFLVAPREHWGRSWGQGCHNRMLLPMVADFEGFCFVAQYRTLVVCGVVFFFTVLFPVLMPDVGDNLTHLAVPNPEAPTTSLEDSSVSVWFTPNPVHPLHFSIFSNAPFLFFIPLFFIRFRNICACFFSRKCFPSTAYFLCLYIFFKNSKSFVTTEF